MDVKGLIAAPKIITRRGEWKHGNKIPKTAFRFSKGNPIRLGKRFHWRTIDLAAGENKFACLVAYRRDKEEFASYLCLMDGTDMKLLARFEFHGTHPGWHVHVECAGIGKIPIGRMMWPGQKRIPRADRGHRRQRFAVDSDEKALFIAAAAFRFLD